MRAWEQFQKTLPQLANPSMSVNFVPAFRGCFVVVQVKHDGNWLRALHLGSAGAPQPESLLTQFCNTLEDVQAQRKPLTMRADIERANRAL
ncbi:MAG TPA: hypothetical protein VFY10_07050 [Dehalococcoidia bacterium]|nr:hypothetical protein [Dehalococcoidia bacterium]